MGRTCGCSRIPRRPVPTAHRGRCARFASQLAQRTLAPVHLEGHSLGALVIYRMFETGRRAGTDQRRFLAAWCPRAAPVQGSQSGRALARMAPARIAGTAGTQELALESAAVNATSLETRGATGRDGRSDNPYGLGLSLVRLPGPNDGTVAISETSIEGATDRCVVHASHMDAG